MQGKSAERGHHEIAASVTDQAFDLAFIVALARTAVAVDDHIMRQHRAETMGAITGAVRHNPGHKAAVIVVKDGARHRAKKGEGMHMPVKPGFGVRRRISADVARIAVWQIKGKEVRLLLDPADDNQRFAKVRLPVPRRMAQGDKHLP